MSQYDTGWKFSPSVDQIPADLIKAGGRTTGSNIHKLNNSIWNTGELLKE
jgi:hypothetical protein